MPSARVVAAPSSSQPLRIEALVKRFGQLTAVDGISLEVNSGECLGLLGPNGAGKIRRCFVSCFPINETNRKRIALVFEPAEPPSNARLKPGALPSH